MTEIYEFDTSKAEKMPFTNDSYQTRKIFSDVIEKTKEYTSEVTISVFGYNRIEKTRRCVESILKYTKGIDYDLILVDNGSDDDTLEYFKSIKFDKVRIIRVVKNLGVGVPNVMFGLNWISKYYVAVANDIVVTENWLNNLIAVAQSDIKIGMVNPMSSNVSNNQMHSLNFVDYEDMQRQAAEFNQSDPTKWQERMRLMNIGSLYTKECLLAIGWPYFDCAFMHDFGDDDISFQIRRAGYKIVLAGDTWIHHDHDIFSMEDKNSSEYSNFLKDGRNKFKEKYYGIDAWDDVVNFVSPFISNNITMPSDMENVKILGVETKCGTPILDIKNDIKRYGIFNAECSAFTCDAKYYCDLKTICNGRVVCDRDDYIYKSFNRDYFDYIIVDKSINEYQDPQNMILNLYSLLKSGGQLFLSLRNTYDISTLLEMAGYDVSNNDSMKHYIHYSINNFIKTVIEMGIDINLISDEKFEVDNTIFDLIDQISQLRKFDESTRNTLKYKLIVKNYWFKITKH